MKVSPTADYPVRVLRREWEESTGDAPLYAGIFAVALNHTVDISFVPDVSSLAPPWDPRLLPADLDDVRTPEAARLATALLSSYVVTPNAALAGTEEEFRWTAGGGPESAGVVFYVEPVEFTGYVAELARLSEIAGRLYSDQHVSALRSYEVITFLERRIVRSPLLGEWHALLLGQRR